MSYSISLNPMLLKNIAHVGSFHFHFHFQIWRIWKIWKSGYCWIYTKPWWTLELLTELINLESKDVQAGQLENPDLPGVLYMYIDTAMMSRIRHHVSLWAQRNSSDDTHYTVIHISLLCASIHVFMLMSSSLQMLTLFLTKKWRP